MNDFDFFVSKSTKQNALFYLERKGNYQEAIWFIDKNFSCPFALGDDRDRANELQLNWFIDLYPKKLDSFFHHYLTLYKEIAFTAQGNEVSRFCTICYLSLCGDLPLSSKFVLENLDLYINGARLIFSSMYRVPGCNYIETLFFVLCSGPHYSLVLDLDTNPKIRNWFSAIFQRPSYELMLSYVRARQEYDLSNNRK